jgi:hypothetical protein
MFKSGVQPQRRLDRSIDRRRFGLGLNERIGPLGSGGLRLTIDRSFCQMRDTLRRLVQHG